jgi:opacity protein-like surface antigen
MTKAIRLGVAMMFSGAVILSASVVEAQTRAWSFSFDAGTQTAVNGDVHSGGVGTVLGLPTVVESRSFDDVYGNGFFWNAGIGYRVGERGEFRLNGHYTNNPAERLQVGAVAGLPLLALFDDYRAFGLDIGYRQYFGDAVARPYVGAGVGFVRLGEVRSEFSVPAAGVILSDVDFLESSTVPAFNFGGGVQIRLSDALALQGGIDLRWHGDANDIDGLAGTGLESINDESRRWSMPITAGLTVRF